MDHLRRLVMNIPSTLLDKPDGVYRDIEAFLMWLEGPGVHEAIWRWERRQRTILKGIIAGLEKGSVPLMPSEVSERRRLA